MHMSSGMRCKAARVAKGKHASRLYIGMLLFIRRLKTEIALAGRPASLADLPAQFSCCIIKEEKFTIMVIPLLAEDRSGAAVAGSGPGSQTDDRYA